MHSYTDPKLTLACERYLLTSCRPKCYRNATVVPGWNLSDLLYRQGIAVSY